MDDLICSLCEKGFDLEERVPRLFPNCGHTFCSACVLELLKSVNGLPSCPDDSIQCSNFLLDKGINSFPINVTV